MYWKPQTPPIGTDPPEPGGSPAGAPPNPYIMPASPSGFDSAKWGQRQQRLRDWQAANPSRTQRQPMGRRADGSVNYDASSYGTNYTGAPIGPNNRAPVTPNAAMSSVQSARPIAPGAFNGAAPNPLRPLTGPRNGAGGGGGF